MLATYVTVSRPMLSDAICSTDQPTRQHCLDAWLMMAKVHWKPKNASFPDTTGPGDLQNVDFMVNSKRFADSGGWGYAVFDYNAASDTELLTEPR